jgi:putative spermidine/putrescine transport system substrate-binding protein
MTDSWLHKKITRRDAISTTGKIAIGAAAAVIVAGGGYLAYNSMQSASPKALTAVTWPQGFVQGAQAVLNPWAQQNGVTMTWELHSGGAATVIAKIQADFPKITRDLIMAFDPVFLQMSSQGWLESLTNDNLPVLASYPESAKIRDPDTKDVVALGWDIIQNGWIYRADLVPSDIDMTKYENWFDPRLKGKLSCSNMTWDTGSSALLPALAYGGNERNIQPGFDFLTKLAKAGNLTQVYSTDNDIATAIGSGKCWLANSDFPEVAFLIKQGYNVKAIFSTEIRAYAEREGWCVLNPPQYPNPKVDLALQALQYFYQPQNLTTYCSYEAVVPSNPEAAIPQGIPTESYVPLDQVDQLCYVPDYAYITQHIDDWEKQFEANVLPVIQSSG